MHGFTYIYFILSSFDWFWFCDALQIYGFFYDFSDMTRNLEMPTYVSSVTYNCYGNFTAWRCICLTSFLFSNIIKIIWFEQLRLICRKTLLFEELGPSFEPITLVLKRKICDVIGMTKYFFYEENTGRLKKKFCSLTGHLKNWQLKVLTLNGMSLAFLTETAVSLSLIDINSLKIYF